MTTPHYVLARRWAAAAVALTITSVGLGLAGPAHADHRNGHATPPGQVDDGTPGNSGEAPGRLKDKDKSKGKPGKDKDKDKPDRDKDKSKDKGTDQPDEDNNGSGGNGNGNLGQGGSGGTDGNDNGNGGGDPAGNNGTVKVGRLGDIDRIPNNAPHPGCVFQVEWYGFDEGPDVVSQVAFTPQAPTRDITIGSTGATSVFVGGDPATGAGTPTGLDGRQTYRLMFTGEPHPKQGFHVRLTVTTPRSKGNDTKTKVFWVQPCGNRPATEGPEVSDESEPTSGTPGSEPVVEDAGGEGRFDTVAPADAREVVAADTGGTVPTVVDAGADSTGSTVLGDIVRSPVGLVLLLAGLVLGVGAVVVRRRAHA